MSELTEKARTNLLKLRVFSYEGDQVSNVQSEDEKDANSVFQKAGVIEPPYHPATLAQVAEASNALRQCAEAMATNIDGFGYRFDPIIDIEANDADEKILEIMRMERIALGEEKPGDKAAGAITFEPSKGEVEARKEQIRSEMLIEQMKLKIFFEYCCPDYSFLTARVRQRIDREFTGNGYWEVTRDGLGGLWDGQINHVPSPTMRVTKRGEWVEVEERVNVTPITYKTRKRKRRFRRYVQVIEGATVYFKEFGDRRLMSALSGKYYVAADPKAALAKMKEEEKDAVPATEIMHFLIYWPRGGAYGVPRWVGNLLSVLGSHQAEEVNFLYFDNKTIPSMLVAVENGTLNDAAAVQLKDLFENGIRGRKNFHKCLVLEAEASNNGAAQDGKVRIHIKPLTDQQMKDALFMQYDAKNRDKVGESFRLPRLLRGDMTDFNRATADAALSLAEDQVFAPERRDFDFAINRKLFAELGIKYHEFVSNGLQLTDPETRAETIQRLADILTPEEGRDLAEPVFGKRLPKIDEPWTKQPLKLTLMEATSAAGDPDADPNDAAEPKAAKGAKKDPKKDPADDEADPKAKDGKVAKGTGLLAEAIQMIRMRDALAKAEGAAAQESFRIETRRNADDEEETVLILPQEVMDEMVSRS